MNILVDSSLTSVKNWFHLIPINVSLDKEDFLDFNEEQNTEKINKSVKKITSFLSPEAIKQKLSKTEVNIIFTIPKSLSGQYNAYQNASFKNTIVCEGHCFFLFENEIQKILSSGLRLKEIKTKIESLNKATKYDGLIISPTHLPRKGRIEKFVLNVLETLYIKVWIQFYNGEWNKKTNFININKTLKKIIQNRKKLTIITVDINTFLKCKELILLINKDIEITYKRMSNAMVAHVGNGFIAIA